MEATKFIKLRPLHKVLAGLLISVVLALVSLSPARVLFRELEFRGQDYLFLFRGPEPVSGAPLVMVLVDEESLEAYGFRSPTPRRLLADLVGQLNAHGARCIGLDFLFPRPHRPEQDLPFANALQASRIPVVIVEPSIDAFTRHAAAGFSKVNTDAQGKAREMVLRQADGKPGFSETFYRACQGQAPILPPAVNPEELILHYYGPPSLLLGSEAPTFQVVAANEVARLPPEVFRDKMVLVGSGAPSLADMFFTPFTTGGTGFTQAFGVELHATALAMFLEGRFLSHLPAGVLAAVLLALFGAVSFTALFFRTAIAGVWFLAIMAGWVAAAGWMFAAQQVLVPMAMPLIFGVLAFLLCQVLLYATETRYSRFLKTTFSRYLSPQVVEEMVERRLGLDLGGELRELSILFSDLAGFTTISEQMTPHDLVQLLNEYLTDMTEVLFAESATVGDFIGDAIMAYFGAPSPQPDHPARACRSALGMQAALAAFNTRMESEGRAKLGMRIGIHTGEVVLGNIGSENRQDFTIIGDAVNLSARLEGVNKMFGTSIIVSEHTLERTGGDFLTRELAKIVVKGKTLPIGIHELLGLAGGEGGGDWVPDEKTIQWHHNYSQGLACFYEGRFEEALSHFQRNGEEGGGDRASQFMAAHAEELLRAPPAGTWDGALVLTEK